MVRSLSSLRNPSPLLRARKVASFNLLSGRERDICTLISAGLSNKEIAIDVDISVYTVKVHLRNIFKKCGVDSRGMLSVLVCEELNKL